MQAEYIDYQYVTAIEAGGNLEAQKTKGRNSLEKKGFLEENFSGDMEVKDEVTTIMRPVFFGERLESLIVAGTDTESIYAYNFHYYNDSIVQSVPTDEGYAFKLISKEDKEKLLEEMIPALENENQEAEEITVNGIEDVRKVISRNYHDVGKVRMALVYFETKNGVYCKEVEDGKFATVSSAEIRKDLCEEVKTC